MQSGRWLRNSGGGGESATLLQAQFHHVFTDDRGYNDLGCFGSQTIKTPNIDRIAREGRKFTNFYVACSVCSPSRAALLTGSYPKRMGLHRGVLFPTSKHGLNPEEYTIADHMKSLGYATACIGKWHLGHHPETLPRQNGFDSYLGIRQGNWKLLVKSSGPKRGKGKKTPATPKPRKAPQILLFDLANDIGETTNLAETQPDKVAALTERMKDLDAEITRHARPVWRAD